MTTKPLVSEDFASLTREQVFAALDEEDERLTEFLSGCISHYAEIVGEELKEGRDYLAKLTPDANIPPIQAIAMEMVLEAVEEELNSEYDEDD